MRVRLTLPALCSGDAMEDIFLLKRKSYRFESGPEYLPVVT